jgi:hypothetical protein
VKWLVIAALVLGGCSKKKQEPAPEPVGSAAPVAAGSATGSAPAPAAGSAAVDIPTEQDFEAQAKTDVDEKNVDTKLKDLEAQLGQ